MNVADTVSTDATTYGVDCLEMEVLVGLCLVADGINLPLTSDGRLARDAFGRDVDLTVLERRPNGARVRETRGTSVFDADGAPKPIVYGALAVMGLVVDTDQPCGWAPTAAGRALAEQA